MHYLRFDSQLRIFFVYLQVTSKLIRCLRCDYQLQAELAAEKSKVVKKDQDLEEAHAALNKATKDFRAHVDGLEANIKDRDKKVSKLQQGLDQKEVELKKALSQL